MAIPLPKKPVDKNQAYFWSRKWQVAEREADEESKTRRVETFDSVEDLLKELG